jgi:hypothetical protein
MAEFLKEDGTTAFEVTVHAVAVVDWRNLAEKHRLLAEQSRISGLFSEIEIAQRFGEDRRVIHKRARAKGLGTELGGFLWFVEADIVELGKGKGSKPCRVNQKELDSGSDRPAATQAEKSSRPLSSSRMEEDRLALDAAKMLARKLKDGSPITSRKNTRRSAANVHYLRSK